MPGLFQIHAIATPVLHQSYSKAISEFLKQYQVIYEGVLSTEITETEKIKIQEEIRFTNERIQSIITSQAQKSQDFRRLNENRLTRLENDIQQQSDLAAAEKTGAGLDSNSSDLPPDSAPDGNADRPNLLPTADGESESVENAAGNPPTSPSSQAPSPKRPKLTTEEQEQFRAARNEMNTYLIDAEEASNAIENDTNTIETTISGIGRVKRDH